MQRPSNKVNDEIGYPVLITWIKRLPVFNSWQKDDSTYP